MQDLRKQRKPPAGPTGFQEHCESLHNVWWIVNDDAGRKEFKNVIKRSLGQKAISVETTRETLPATIL
jgi:hypothetical protein